jgi:hypothetical protein
MLCLQILQSSLACINTLMIQDTLAEPEWVGVLGDADRRGLTPLFHANMTPYLDTLQNRYGPGPAVSRADPILEAVGGHRNGTCPPAAIRNCPEMACSVTGCYWMPVAAAADPFCAPPLAQGWVGGSAQAGLLCCAGLPAIRLSAHPGVSVKGMSCWRGSGVGAGGGSHDAGPGRRGR